MLLIEIALAYGLIVLGQSSAEPGVIRGRVVNMSKREAPCAGAEVILRAQVDGEFAPVAKTVTDAEGNYRFEGLPVGPEYLYLPGANREQIHYPGRRVGLTRGHPTAYVTLEVRDTVAEPSPLVIRQHEIVIGMEAGAVHVVEALLVDNPTAATFVGRAKSEGTMPVTMRLHIPTDFERVTFEKEQFGREFQIVDGRLVTGIPWTPGRQWLKFTYTLRNQTGKLVWQRPLDAPCEAIRVRVKHAPASEIACNLPPAADGPPGEAVFQSGGVVLPTGHEIRAQLGNAPVPWPVYGRWAALMALVGSIAGMAIHMRRTRRNPKPAADVPGHATSRTPHRRAPPRGPGRPLPPPRSADSRRLSTLREASGVSFQLARPRSTASWKLTPRRIRTVISRTVPRRRSIAALQGLLLL